MGSRYFLRICLRGYEIGVPYVRERGSGKRIVRVTFLIRSSRYEVASFPLRASIL